MPAAFARLATVAAAEAGFDGFAPDACLVNRYVPGARLSLHQDRDERDFDAPIVSVSLGLPATFLFGGTARADKAARVPLAHGDRSEEHRSELQSLMRSPYAVFRLKKKTQNKSKKT